MYESKYFIYEKNQVSKLFKNRFSQLYFIEVFIVLECYCQPLKWNKTLLCHDFSVYYCVPSQIVIHYITQRILWSVTSLLTIIKFNVKHSIGQQNIFIKCYVS